MAQLNVISSNGSEQPVTSAQSSLQQTATSDVTAPSTQNSSQNNDKVMNFLNAEASGSSTQPAPSSTWRSKIVIGGISVAIAIFCVALLMHYKQIIHHRLNKPKS